MRLVVDRFALDINELIRRRIDDLGLDVRDLAVRLGVSHTTVYNWKREHSEVPVSMWVAIERELGLKHGTLAELAGVHPGKAKSNDVVYSLKPFRSAVAELLDVTKRLAEALGEQ